jgi:hypothetical protein
MVFLRTVKFAIKHRGQGPFPRPVSNLYAQNATEIGEIMSLSRDQKNPKNFPLAASRMMVTTKTARPGSLPKCLPAKAPRAADKA